MSARPYDPTIHPSQPTMKKLLAAVVLVAVLAAAAAVGHSLDQPCEPSSDPLVELRLGPQKC